MELREALHRPTEAERRLLDQLLSVDFPGRNELREQVRTASVRWLPSRGAPALIVETRPDSPPASVVQRVPVEATCLDEDGQVMHLLVHVVDQRLSEVEIFREDGERMLRFPDGEGLSVIAP